MPTLTFNQEHITILITGKLNKRNTMQKDSRLEIRINKETKDNLQIIASHLTTTGTVTELLLDLIENIIATNRKLLTESAVK